MSTMVTSHGRFKVPVNKVPSIISNDPEPIFEVHYSRTVMDISARVFTGNVTLDMEFIQKVVKVTKVHMDGNIFRWIKDAVNNQTLNINQVTLLRDFTDIMLSRPTTSLLGRNSLLMNKSDTAIYRKLKDVFRDDNPTELCKIKFIDQITMLLSVNTNRQPLGIEINPLNELVYFLTYLFGRLGNIPATIPDS